MKSLCGWPKSLSRHRNPCLGMQKTLLGHTQKWTIPIDPSCGSPNHCVSASWNDLKLLFSLCGNNTKSGQFGSTLTVEITGFAIEITHGHQNDLLSDGNFMLKWHNFPVWDLSLCEVTDSWRCRCYVKYAQCVLSHVTQKWSKVWLGCQKWLSFGEPPSCLDALNSQWWP